ncbi:MAG TPA: hypothetical protein ENH46_04895 [Candidatus Pacearchaeota archaeon]|nr:hypothetical protein [Candidatus Pacearchaeota archaeon]
METQNELELPIGTKETESLKPVDVKIESVKIQEVGDKGSKKVIFTVKHPDREETIEISAVKYEKNKGLIVSGLWFNLDEDEKIKKGSALALCMGFFKVENLKGFEGLEIPTTEDERGYLCIKSY